MTMGEMIVAAFNEASLVPAERWRMIKMIDETLAAREVSITAAVEIIKRYQWGHNDECRECFADSSEGHKPHCAIGQFLAAEGAE